MKRKWFNPALYVEGLRQLRLMGILFTAAASLVALFIPFGEYFSSLSMKGGVQLQDVTCLNMNPLIILSFCIVAPLLTLNLFSFLNKRESSDFYHAIPATRQCLFFSFFAAVMTWLLIFMVVSTGLAIAGHALFPKLFAIHYGNVIRTFFNCFAAGTLVAASVAIAMSVTGTFLMNVLISLILIFLPRILIHLVMENIGYAFPLVNGLAFAPLFSMQYNVPAGYVLQYFLTADVDNILTSFSSGLYTLVLGLIYIGIAALLFTHRKSESAGQSAPNRYLQALFRFLVGFTISSIVTLAVFNELIHGYLDIDDLFAWFFLYVIAVFVMLAFELLCTRRWRGLIRRGAVTIGFLAIANLVLLGAVWGVNQSLRNYTPTADEITSVRLQVGESYNNDYFNKKTETIDIRDATVRKLVADRLEHTVNLLKTSENAYYDELRENSEMIVYIKDGGRQRVRRIIFTADDIELLSKSLNKQTVYRDVYMKLPIGYAYISGNNLYLERGIRATTLFETMQSEINEIGFEMWYAIVNGRDPALLLEDALKEDPNAVSQILDHLHLRISEGSEWSSINVPLYPSVMPRTCNAYIELCNNATENARDMVMNTLLHHPDSLEYLDAQLIGTDGSVQASFWWDRNVIMSNHDAFVTMATALDEYQPATIDSQKPLILLSCNVRVNKTDEDNLEYYDSIYCCGYFALPEGLVFPDERM